MEKLMLKKQRKEKIFDSSNDPSQQRRCISAKTHQEMLNTEKNSRADKSSSADYISKDKYNNNNNSVYEKSGNIAINSETTDPRLKMLDSVNTESSNGFDTELRLGSEEEQRTSSVNDADSNNTEMLFKKRDWRNKHHSHMMASYFEIGVASPDLIDAAFEPENNTPIITEDDGNDSFVDVGDIDGSNTITGNMNEGGDGYWRPISSVSTITIEPLDD